MANSIIYQVLKQGYPATHTFKDEADGTSGTDIEFVDTAVLYNGACEIVSDWQGHRKVLRMTDDVTPGENPYIIHTETQATAGTREFWVGTNDVTQFWYFYFSESGVEPIVRLRIGGSNFQYLDNVDVWQTIQAAASDIWYHIKVVWRADNTFDVYIEGIKQVDNVATNNNQVSGVNQFYIRCYGDSTKYCYFDAYGDPDNDTDYKIGDNIHWRHYKDQDSDFESEDCGTTSTSIGFVDTDNSGGVGTATIIPSFDEHKKILELYHGPLVADKAEIENNFASAQPNGTIEFWVKTSDAGLFSSFNIYSGGVIKLQLRLAADLFQWYDGAWKNLSTTPLDDTWYHIRMDFECAAGLYKGLAADTATIYINNISQGTYSFGEAADDLDVFHIVLEWNLAYYTYIDAVSYSWTSGNELADNRTLEYHSLTKTDITSKCSDCSITKAVTSYSTATIETTQTLGDEHYLQIIDGNSDLRFIGNRFKVLDIGISGNGYIFQGLNKVDLEKENSYTASSAEDVNASLLGVLTTVGQADGRLIYYTEDDPAGNLTPNYRNKPLHMIVRILAIKGGKKGIIKASGKIFIDDDANPDNGAATIVADSSELMGIPKIDRTSHQINYVEVRGGIDPDTGTPFSGISEDATAQADGTGIIPYYKRLRELQSDTDCQNMAIAIRTGTNFTPQLITIRLRGIYADPGEIINLTYPDKSFSATNCYVDSVRMNVLTGVCYYSLNTGIFDRITLNAPGYTMADETADDVAESLYKTDINTVYLRIVAHNGATETNGGVLLDAVNEMAIVFWYNAPNIDTSREIHIYVQFYRSDANGDTITIAKDLTGQIADGGNDTVSQWAGTADTLDACGATREMAQKFTLTSANNYANYRYTFSILMNEAGRSIYIRSIAIVYYLKRSL